jgi:hypothetical protein
MPALAQQLVQLLGQLFSSIMSAIAMSEPVKRFHLSKQFRESLRDGSAKRDLIEDTTIKGDQLFDTESSDP